ncbi:MAG: NAD(P)H-dependent oxidoreductase subunit E [Candidatus Latescibacterota bacterium]
MRNEAHLEKASQVKLAQEDLGNITEILERNKGQGEVLLPVLQEVNLRYKYLPEDILRYLSFAMDIPLSHIYNIATFYNAFSLKPRGRYTIQVCLGTACHVEGGQRLFERLERDLGIKDGETTEDLNFTLESVHCLGCCGLAPVVTVGDELYGKMEQARLPKIIAQYKGE